MSIEYPCVFNDQDTVQRYDRLRHIDEGVVSRIAGLIASLIVPTSGSAIQTILDAGAGTGRFLIPVAQAVSEKGLSANLVGVDLCGPMLVRLRERWLSSDANVRLQCIEADLQEPLPFLDESVHLVFTVATLHILTRWREALDNLTRVLSPNGYFALIRENNQFMHETEGFDHDDDFTVLDIQLQNFMRHYHQQRDVVGEPYQRREVCYSDMMVAIRYLASLGLEEQQLEYAEGAFEWQKPHTYMDILHCFKKRQMTTWGSDLSDRDREKVGASLEKWMNSRGIDLEEEFLLPAKLIPHVFRKPR